MPTTNYWAVVPASGIGARMGGGVPKQYLPLCGHTVIEQTLQRLATHTKISGIVVALAANDDSGRELLKRMSFPGKHLSIVTGGAERCHSVLNALQGLAAVGAPDDWVLVHDAVRPCLRHVDIDALIDALCHHDDGGLLGVRVSDTVKRVTTSGEVIETLNRDELWRAMTPQMFHLAKLTSALSEAVALRQFVTDEASAMALMGASPIMVEAHSDNIKITHVADLALAEFYLEQQRVHACE